MSENEDKIVGHKTMADGTHIPLRHREASEIWAQVETAKARRLELMPDSMVALSLMHDALIRLEDEGWRKGPYCPKDGSEFAVIQHGSTGIFSAFYSGKWPDGYVICCDFVHHPDGLLWKQIADLSDAERAKMAECMEVDGVMRDREIAAFGAMDQL